MAIFPSLEWVNQLSDKLNSDERYGQIARNWEGDLKFQLEPDERCQENLEIYLDLWHGKCRKGTFNDHATEVKPVFILSAPYKNFIQILEGELDPMQAMLTRKLRVQGNLVYMMRNIPTVLDFVRCCRDVTDGTL